MSIEPRPRDAANGPRARRWATATALLAESARTTSAATPYASMRIRGRRCTSPFVLSWDETGVACLVRVTASRCRGDSLPAARAASPIPKHLRPLRAPLAADATRERRSRCVPTRDETGVARPVRVTASPCRGDSLPAARAASPIPKRPPPVRAPLAAVAARGRRSPRAPRGTPRENGCSREESREAPSRSRAKPTTTGRLWAAPGDPRLGARAGGGRRALSAVPSLDRFPGRARVRKRTRPQAWLSGLAASHLPAAGDRADRERAGGC